MNPQLERTPGIYLAGFMGCGKSTVGRLLANELRWKFVDLDEQIEAASGQTVSELFRTRGEEEFRRVEERELARVVNSVKGNTPTVVSLGGGTFAREANYNLIANNGVSIWLDCPLDVIERRVARQNHRPLALDAEKFRALYHSRRPAYQRADYRVEVNDADARVHLDAILKLPVFDVS